MKKIQDLMHFKIPFEKGGSLSDEDAARTYNKAISYHGLKEEDAKLFISNAETLAQDLRKNLLLEIMRRTKLFVYHVNSYISSPLVDEEEEAIGQIVRHQIASCPDEETLSRHLFRLAEQMGEFFKEREESS